MKAGIASEGGLVIADIPAPQPKPHEVLVRVRAAGLNRADLNAARARSHASHGAAGSAIGMEWAGEVTEAGAEVKGFKPGDRVMCSGVGGYAEYAAADAGRTIKLPDDLAFEDAGVLPLALLTMHDALVTKGRLQAGESVLIQGASSGVGIAGMKIAKLLGASLVIGTSANDARRARLREFGADLALDPRGPGFVDEVLQATGGKGVHLVVDMVSGPQVNDLMKAAAVLGRIVNVGRLGGARAEFDFDLHALRRIDYVGVTFRTRSIEEVREINRRMQADLLDFIAAGRLRLPIDRKFPLAEAPAAHAHMRANAHFGKIALVP
ncbi:MAG: zinc-binding dehydrogenase [Bradyrhizobiaceae bacterium]|nr:zinc-binding dehydrogenase [Bradyrhizobiaceae bacterium]